MCGHCLTLCRCGAGMGIKLPEMCGVVRVEHEHVWVLGMGAGMKSLPAQGSITHARTT